jgi:hypothetical protein
MHVLPLLLLLLLLQPLQVVDAIEQAQLVREKDFDVGANDTNGTSNANNSNGGGPLPPMSVTELYDMLETKRMARLDGLVQKYSSIEGLLIKVSSVSL